MCTTKVPVSQQLAYGTLLSAKPDASNALRRNRETNKDVLANNPSTRFHVFTDIRLFLQHAPLRFTCP